jgi:flagellar biosynthesis/type III secretory pathway protein FliH
MSSLETDSTEGETETVRIVGQPNRKADFVMSQKDYRPTPFRDNQYEVVGERFDTKIFTPIELTVIPSEHGTDPMFEDFGVTIPKGATTYSQMPGVKSSKDEEEKPALDEAAIQEALTIKFEAGKAEGFAEGEAKAKEEILERYTELNASLEGFTQEVKASVAEAIKTIEANAVQLALAVAKKVLITTAECRPECIADVIRHAMNAAGSSNILRIRVSHNDHEFLSVIGLPADLTSETAGIEYVVDETIHSGCVVETNFGEIDLQLERMWEQVKEQLFGV